MSKVGKALGFLALAATGFGLAAAGFGAIGFVAGGVAASVNIASFVAQVALSAGLSALSLALQKKPRAPGITTQETQTGGTAPQSLIVGRYATGGQLMAPRMTHGSAGKTPNAFLTYVVAISDVPGVQLSRVFIDGEVGDIGVTPHPDYGLPVTLKGVAGRAWIRWYDGSQTVADPMLIAKYGSRPNRPWQADMIGTGLTYAILTFRFDRNLYRGFPTVRFEVDGIALYDPRADSSVGGSGSQRRADPASWAPSDNPAVMIYNIALGIPIPGGDIWGGGWQQADLPLASWFAAMNTCDEPEPLAAGGFEPRYRAGLEITVDSEPADAMAELLNTCSGRTADIGGTLKINVGAPPPAVFALTDADIITSSSQSADLFPGLAETHNAVAASFPDPDALWQTSDAPPRFDPVAEAEDGRRLVGDVSLPACPYAQQVQRLMVAWLADERRFRRHQIVLPPDYSALEPMDTVQVTSDRNGYSNKTFEVVEVTSEPNSLITVANIREVDAADFDWNSTLELPWVSPAPGDALPVAQSVPGFAVAGGVLDDQLAQPRRPVLILTWDGADQDDVTGMDWEVRRVGDTNVLTGTVADVTTGRLVVSGGILPLTAYEARARFIASRPVSWTAWLPATTPDVRLIWADIDPSIQAQVTDAENVAAAAGADAVAALAAANAVAADASTALVLRPIGGTGAANIRIVEWDDVAGAGSAIVLNGDNVVAPGTLSTSRLVVTEFGLNLVGNGSFAAGDLRGWVPVPATFALVAKDTGSGTPAIANAPTGHVLQMDPTGALAGSLIAEGVAAAGDSFALGFDHAISGAGDAQLLLRVQWLDVAGAIILLGGITPTITSSVWSRTTGVVTAPPGTVRYKLFFNRQAGGTAVAYATRIEALRQRAGSILITPQSIGGAQMITTEALITNSAQIDDAIITSAKIANVIQSTNFVAGVAGWQINKAGNAEFNTLVVRRGNIEDGAITDKVVSTQASVLVSRDTQSYALNPVAIGAVASDELRFIGWGGNISRITTYHGVVEVERRVKISATIWQPWVSVFFDNTPLLQPAGTYSFGGGEFLSGQFFGVEYRFKTNMSGSNIPATSTNVLSNLKITASKIVK